MNQGLPPDSASAQPDYVPGAEIMVDGELHPPRCPHLQVFGPGTGPFQFKLPAGSVTIGRSQHADIHLPHQTVSRVHATLSPCNGGHVLEDANSRAGTTVNSQRIDTHRLRHGDSIQITLYVLEYRTHAALPGAAAATARAKFLLRTDFCLLPSTMRLRIRTLKVSPRDVFRPGDTLKVGNGGLLIPTPTPPPDAVCLELRMFWPNDHNKRYLGEIMGVIPDEHLHWMCVKLHTVPKDTHRLVVAASSPGAWTDIPAT